MSPDKFAMKNKKMPERSRRRYRRANPGKMDPSWSFEEKQAARKWSLKKAWPSGTIARIEFVGTLLLATAGLGAIAFGYVKYFFGEFCVNR